MERLGELLLYKSTIPSDVRSLDENPMKTSDGVSDVNISPYVTPCRLGLHLFTTSEIIALFDIELSHGHGRDLNHAMPEISLCAIISVSDFLVLLAPVTSSERVIETYLRTDLGQLMVVIMRLVRRSAQRRPAASVDPHKGACGPTCRRVRAHGRLQ